MAKIFVKDGYNKSKTNYPPPKSRIEKQEKVRKATKKIQMKTTKIRSVVEGS